MDRFLHFWIDFVIAWPEKQNWMTLYTFSIGHRFSINYIPRFHLREIISQIFMNMTKILVFSHQCCVNNPSLETYERLHEIYSTTLKCPCSNISTAYGDLIRSKDELHQMCSISLVFTGMDWVRFWLSEVLDHHSDVIEPSLIFHFCQCSRSWLSKYWEHQSQVSVRLVGSPRKF